MKKSLKPETRISLPLLVVLALALVAGCSQETADRAAKAVENAPGQMERQAERSLAVLDDVTVTTKVKAALIAEPNLKGFAIDVDTAQNVVTLTGTVQSDDARAAAERVTKQVEGVKEVRNNITVKQAS